MEDQNLGVILIIPKVIIVLEVIQSITIFKYYTVPAGRIFVRPLL